MSRIRGMLEGDVPQRKVLERNENERSKENLNR
jgi:hypothetical protein